MALYIEITSGDQVGSKYLISEGITLGRTKTDIVLNDSKVSSLHAKVEKDASGQLVLVDQNSSNGLYLSDQKTKRIVLADGVKIQIGRVFFKIISVSDEVPTGAEGSVEPWTLTLKNSVDQLVMDNVPQPMAVQALSPGLTLEFLEGPHEGRKVFLGFGPRHFGAESLDFEIEEPDTARQAFSIIPTQGQARFENLDPHSVTINNRPISTEKLVEGDVIQVGTTLIKVHIEEKK